MSFKTGTTQRSIELFNPTILSADVCRSCGGTLDYPKVMPRLPFYQEGTTHFSPASINTGSMAGSCGGAGPNMIYMLVPPWDMVS